MSRVDAPARRSILVVDDDPSLRGLFTTLLAREGFTVDCAPNGRQAFEYIRRGSYSVILLDLMMPDVNGFELLDRLERDSPALLRRVIVLTGAAQRVVDGLEPKRVWGVVRKPFDVSELIKSCRECAASRAMGERRAPSRGNARPSA